MRSIFGMSNHPRGVQNIASAIYRGQYAASQTTLVDGEFQPGFICYDIPVGSREYVRHHNLIKVQEVAREVGKVLGTLEGEGQNSNTKIMTTQKLKW